MKTSDMSTPAGKAAILIVNGGANAEANRWIRLCLEKIAALTTYPSFHIYVWNHRIEDSELERWLLSRPKVTLLSAAGYEVLHHPHRTPLQRLYHLAREEHADYVVALASDAHPIRNDWLTHLIAAVEDGAALAGVWCDEMEPVIRAHVHASCLCTAVDFIERHQLRFDFDNTHSQENTDTLSHFTRVAEEGGLPVHKLIPSNPRKLDDWFGEIYGDLIYHHVASGRRRAIPPESSLMSVMQIAQHRCLRDRTAELLFEQYEPYMAWLTGRPIDPSLDARIRELARRTDTTRSPRWWREHACSTLEREQMRLYLFRRMKSMVKRNPWAMRMLRPMTPRRRGREVQSAHKPPYKSDATVKAFQEENLFPVPSNGWRAGPPDYVGIGPPKCGTSWWYSLMFSHPQIVTNRVFLQDPRNKELQYFVHFQFGAMSERERELYNKAFATCPGTICGEFSTQYFRYPGAFAHLADTAPQAKILVILRNPIDRFVSHWNHLVTRRDRRAVTALTERQASIFKHYSAYAEAMQASRYGDGLAAIFESYPREQVLVLQYERMVIAPEIELARTYRFLGVDDRFRPHEYRNQVNKGKYVIPKPTPDDRRRLAAYLKRDVHDTLALCPEIEPTLWPDFA